MHISATPQDFLEHSLQLLEARPSTTRITTKYSSPPTAKKLLRQQQKRAAAAAAASKSTSGDADTRAITTAPATSIPAQSVGKLVIKTYDPVSGAGVKFATNKAADIGRLVGVLGRAGRFMGGLGRAVPVGGADAGEKGDVVMGEAPPTPQTQLQSVPPVVRVGTPVSAQGGSRAGTPVPGQSAQGGGAGGGKGKKKKKGGK
ncbi:signal recognition particle 9 kDa protein-domain-containing protein [Kalaharituber pfeilii]|nr:signal recognition particle 9 kDa protein-domain-containing protein [Kalaharituber pfeilii]